MRIQLDPNLDIRSIPNITPGEIAIARALQKYGAYCGDKSDNGIGWGFTGELDQTAHLTEDGQVYIGDTYFNAGFLWDYFQLNSFNWGAHLRVLKNWDGTDVELEIGYSPT